MNCSFFWRYLDLDPDEDEDEDEDEEFELLEDLLFLLCFSFLLL
jgi:hypothetical protein